ncbi:unnamed protein product, partial [Polarella glacialis]
MASTSLEAERVRRGLGRLARNTRDLLLPKQVPRRPASSIGALEFVRDFVAASQPLVLTDLPVQDWPCLERWTEAYLLEQVGDPEVSVNVTPNGLGDFVDEQGRFVKPLEERLRFRDFWGQLQGSFSQTAA